MTDAVCRVYLLPNGVGKGRLAIFRQACRKFSLQCQPSFDFENVDCIIVEDTLNPHVIIERILHLNPTDHNLPQLVSTRWLSESLRAQTLLPREHYVRSLTVEEPSLSMEETQTSSLQSICPKLNSEHFTLPRVRSKSDSDYEDEEETVQTDQELIVCSFIRHCIIIRIDPIHIRN